MSKRDRSLSPESAAVAHAQLYLASDSAKVVKKRNDLITVEYTTSARRKGKQRARDEAQPGGDASWLFDDDIGSSFSPQKRRAQRSPSPALDSEDASTGEPSEQNTPLEEEAEEEEEETPEQKRARLEESRQERMRLLEAEEREAAKENKPAEEELDEAQTELMCKLALTLSQSNDPTLLEIRILANHGHDPRFAFLRKGGKWGKEWKEIKESRMASKKVPAKATAMGASASAGSEGGLVAYDSDSEEEEQQIAQPPPPQIKGEGAEEEGEAEFKRKQEAKAEKARAWAEKRRLAREAAADGTPSS